MTAAERNQSIQERKASTLTERELHSFIERNPDLIPGASGADFSQAVCIARSIVIGRQRIDCIFVSPAGKVAIVISDDSAQNLVYATDRIKYGGIEFLDSIASEYSFRKDGQAFRVIDIMAARGLLTYSDESSFSDHVNSNLSSGALLVIAVGEAIKGESEVISSYLSGRAAPAFNVVFVER